MKDFEILAARFKDDSELSLNKDVIMNINETKFLQGGPRRSKRLSGDCNFSRANMSKCDQRTCGDTGTSVGHMCPINTPGW